MVIIASAAETTCVLHTLFGHLAMLFRCKFVRAAGCPIWLAGAFLWFIFLLDLLVVSRLSVVVVAHTVDIRRDCRERRKSGLKRRGGRAYRSTILVKRGTDVK